MTDPAQVLNTRDGHGAKNARRIAAVFSLGCLLAAAGLLIASLAKVFAEAARSNAEKASAAQNAAASQEGIAHDGPMTVRSLRQTEEHGLRLYDGDVRIELNGWSLRCQHAQHKADGSQRPFRLVGSGGVVIQGMPGFPRLKADSFAFDSRNGGLLTLAGEVQVEGPAGPQKYRLCAIDLSDPAAGRIVKARSLLDDFAASQTIVRKLAILDDIAVIYRDEELPPAALWLLAMKLLEPHLAWRDKEMAKPQGKSPGGEHAAGNKEPAAPKKEPTASGPASFDAAVWPAALLGEPWMSEGPAYWRLEERRHVDVLRAMKLLAQPGADAADDQRRTQWLTEIGRNNTILRMVVEPHYRSSAAAIVVVDVRNADRLALKLYRVGNGAAWAAVRQRQGRDFIYADSAAHFMPLTDEGAGPKKLEQLMENLVVEWTVQARELAHDPACAEKHPAADGEGAWYGNRKLTVSDPALARAGYYILALEANGETAFAPLHFEAATPGN